MKKIKVSWGSPTDYSYDQILDIYSGTKINSIQTSSIPLAQYWKELDHAVAILNSNVNIGLGFPDWGCGHNPVHL